MEQPIQRASLHHWWQCLWPFWDSNWSICGQGSGAFIWGERRSAGLQQGPHPEGQSVKGGGSGGAVWQAGEGGEEEWVQRAKGFFPQPSVRKTLLKARATSWRSTLIRSCRWRLGEGLGARSNRAMGEKTQPYINFEKTVPCHSFLKSCNVRVVLD